MAASCRRTLRWQATRWQESLGPPPLPPTCRWVGADVAGGWVHPAVLDCTLNSHSHRLPENLPGPAADRHGWLRHGGGRRGGRGQQVRGGWLQGPRGLWLGACRCGRPGLRVGSWALPDVVWAAWCGPAAAQGG